MRQAQIYAPAYAPDANPAHKPYAHVYRVVNRYTRKRKYMRLGQADVSETEALEAFDKARKEIYDNSEAGGFS